MENIPSIQAERDRYAQRVVELRRELAQAEAILAGFENALNGGSGPATPALLKTQAVLDIIGAADGWISKPDLRQKLAEAGYNTKHPDFLSRFNIVLRRQIELRTITRKITPQARFFTKGPEFGRKAAL